MKKEKERKAKEEAAKKAKANQIKQQQKQLEKKTAQAAPAAKKGPVSSGGGISVVSVETPKKDGVVSNISNNELNEPIPRIPDNVLKVLKSENNGIRSHLSLVILGHVDAGKSTLTGRLMLSLNHVSQRQLQKYQKAATTIGKSSFALAWFCDEDESERERGVTIDIATKFVQTENFDFTVLDAPGHKDFIPNMISGTASADAGLLVVAATTGEFEAGFAMGGDDGDGSRFVGQTREHIVLSRGLGVTQIVVAVNKLDAADPAWSKARFEHIKGLVLDFLKHNSFKEKRIKFVPVSGLTGVNMSREGKLEDEEGMKLLRIWYNGPTLIEALDGFVPAKRDFEKPLRSIVTDVSSEGKNVTVRARVVQGFVRAGDGVTVLPIGDNASVVRVERGRAEKEGASVYSYAIAQDTQSKDGLKEIGEVAGIQNCALAGEIAELTLSGIDAARLSPGCVISHRHPSLRPNVKRRFEARVMVMDKLAVPIIRGSQVLLHMSSIDVPAVLSKLISSERRGDAKPRQNPRVLAGGVTATVEITLSEKLVLEESNQCKALGRFVLRRGGDTVAVGLIDKVL